MLVYFFLLITDSLARRRVNLHIIAGGAVELFPQRFGIPWAMLISFIVTFVAPIL